MKRKFLSSLLVGAGMSVTIFAVEAFAGRGLLLASCDGMSLAGAALIALGAIKWLNSDRIKHSALDLSKSIFKKMEEDEAPTKETAKEKAASGIAMLLAGAVLLGVSLALMLML